MLSYRIFTLVATVSRLMQWTSSVIVLGIVAWFMAHYEHDPHNVYQLVIAALMVVLYLPAIALPFMTTSGERRAWYWPVDFVFSYLWLTSFIFAAQDYNHPGQCAYNAPNNGGSCAMKKASESFIFLAFFFTILALVTETSTRDTTPTATPSGTTPAGTTNGHNNSTAAAGTGHTNGASMTGAGLQPATRPEKFDPARPSGDTTTV